jgi:hypothetical protein
MYSHPWEYNERAKEKNWKIPGFVVRHAGDEQLERLQELITCFRKAGQFITFSEYLKESL